MELKAAGFSGSQAEAIVGTVNRAMAINEQIARDLAAVKARVDNEMVTRADLKNFATKDDLKHFATKLDFADLRTEMAEGFGALRAEMKDSITGVYRSTLRVVIGTFSVFIAILMALRIWG